MLDKMTNRMDFLGNALILRAERQRRRAIPRIDGADRVADHDRVGGIEPAVLRLRGRKRAERERARDEAAKAEAPESSHRIVP